MQGLQEGAGGCSGVCTGSIWLLGGSWSSVGVQGDCEGPEGVCVGLWGCCARRCDLQSEPCISLPWLWASVVSCSSQCWCCSQCWCTHGAGAAHRYLCTLNITESLQADTAPSPLCTQDTVAAPPGSASPMGLAPHHSPPGIPSPGIWVPFSSFQPQEVPAATCWRVCCAPLCPCRHSSGLVCPKAHNTPICRAGHKPGLPCGGRPPPSCLSPPSPIELKMPPARAELVLLLMELLHLV